ncbi:MAG TPA: hypothetical protein VHN15_08570 [Thermoanaerobaculia bacterium]|nr:hypothetical protein [Thermoanaerobaculia bacterium]
MLRSVRFVSAICLALPLVLAPPANAASGIDPALLAGMKARSIGPAAMSGRVTSVVGAESNPDLLYVGTAAGGVWKSVNGGLNWEPIFDDQPVPSIGAVAVFQPTPDIVWVGTGEGNVRNSVSYGGGVYRSLDGGRNWQFLGLEKTERIPRVVLHPTNPDVAYVAALGPLWSDGADRGVYKTLDGGRNWRKVLYVDGTTGAADLAMDPSNPNRLIVSMWDFHRQPWNFRSGGAGSGLYITHDGGDTWKKLTEEDGLPKGDLGRAGISYSRSNPSTVYALVEAQRSALLRSDDNGRRWRTVNSNQDTADRPFYYADILVDPGRPDRVYNIATRLTVSNDGGATFGRLGRSNDLHSDYHALWINPNDPEHMVTGNDGGLGISRDRGETWQFVANLPISQYYHVSVDMDTPYNIYGGLQDNGSWRGPSSVWESGGIRNHHWQRIGFGDGFDARPLATDSLEGYSMSQGGNLLRWNLRSGEIRGIRPPEVNTDDYNERLRFNWNAALGVDPFEPDTLYYGSQYVHKSTDRGESWTVISPDLTTNRREWQSVRTGGLTPDETGAENFTTILAIAPSPVAQGTIWVGTDDGRIHVTRNGGQSWESLEKNVRGVPANTWVPHIKASTFDAGTAFVVFDNHRRGDFKPYAYRTDDYGKTWKSLVTPEIDSYVLAIEQDPVDRDLLFLGTERGLYVSTDAGKSWMRWKHGVPPTSVMDLVVHPRDHDLVVATHGRAVYVLDNVAPLRDLTPEVMKKPVHVFASAPGILHSNRQPAGTARGGGSGEFQGEDRPYGALITYSLNQPGLPHPDAVLEKERKEKERAEARQARERQEQQKRASGEAAATELREDPPAEEPAAASAAPAGRGRRGAGGAAEGPKVEIRITDASGKLVRKMEGPANLGVNRVTWNLGRDGFRQPPREEGSFGGFGGFDSGPQVPPGTYTVTVKSKDQEAKGTVQVVPSSFLAKTTDADWQAREAAIQRLGDLQGALVEAIERVRSTRDEVDALVRRARPAETPGTPGTDAKPAEDPAYKELSEAAKQLNRKLTDLEKRLFQPPGTRGIVNDDETALTQLQAASFGVSASWGAPNPTHKANLARAEKAVEKALQEFNQLFAQDVAAFRQKVEQSKVNLLPKTDPVTIGAKKP